MLLGASHWWARQANTAVQVLRWPSETLQPVSMGSAAGGGTLAGGGLAGPRLLGEGGRPGPCAGQGMIEEWMRQEVEAPRACLRRAGRWGTGAPRACLRRAGGRRTGAIGACLRRAGGRGGGRAPAPACAATERAAPRTRPGGSRGRPAGRRTRAAARCPPAAAAAPTPCTPSRSLRRFRPGASDGRAARPACRTRPTRQTHRCPAGRRSHSSPLPAARGRGAPPTALLLRWPGSAHGL